MKTAIRGVLLGGLLCAAGGLFGCEAYIDPGYPGEPAPAAYTYGPGYDYYYYDSGWYRTGIGATAMGICITS